MNTRIKCQITDGNGEPIAAGCGDPIYRSQYSESYLLADGTLHGGKCLIDYALASHEDGYLYYDQSISPEDDDASIDDFIERFKADQGAVRLSEVEIG